MRTELLVLPVKNKSPAWIALTKQVYSLDQYPIEKYMYFNLASSDSLLQTTL